MKHFAEGCAHENEWNKYRIGVRLGWEKRNNFVCNKETREEGNDFRFCKEIVE